MPGPTPVAPVLKHFQYTVRVENFEVFLISRFSWVAVADDTKIIHVEGGINTCEIFYIRQNLELHEIFHPRNFPPIYSNSKSSMSSFYKAE